MNVITYRYAYLSGQIDLCATHGAAPPEWVPSLGPVNHGEHAGLCFACRHYPVADYEPEPPGGALAAAQWRAGYELDCDPGDIEVERHSSHLMCVRVR